MHEIDRCYSWLFVFPCFSASAIAPQVLPKQFCGAMKLIHTPGGLEATLRPPGMQRFTGAGFLTVWLTFWAFGEVFVIWILATGAWALFTGQPPGPGRSLLETGPALTLGLFLLCWLAFWTFGGVMAG